MSDAPKNGGKAATLLLAGASGLGGAIATGASLWAFVNRPNEVRIAALESELSSVRQKLESHVGLETHPGTAARMISITQEFAKIETQIGKINAVVNGQFQDLWRWVVVIGKGAGYDIPMPTFWPKYGEEK